MNPDSPSIEQVITSVLSSLSGNGVTELTPDMTIQDDLCIDSVTFVFAVMQVQEQLGLDFFAGGTKATAVRTVGDFAATCHACIARTAQAAADDPRASSAASP